MLGSRHFGPRWTRSRELLTDVAVIVRLTLARGTRVFLAAGCLTLGVLGAAMYFLEGERGAANSGYVDELVGGRDFVLVAEVTRIGDITDVADLSVTGPMLLLARNSKGAFDVMVDGTDGKGYRPA